MRLQDVTRNLVWPRAALRMGLSWVFHLAVRQPFEHAAFAPSPIAVRAFPPFLPLRPSPSPLREVKTSTAAEPAALRGPSLGEPAHLRAVLGA